MLDQRASGILLHPTSLPGPYGIGDLGGSAYRFVDFLQQSGQRVWQILPLGPAGAGNSPYLAYSALAGNPLLISPEILHGEGLLTEGELAEVKQVFSQENPAYVRFDQVGQHKYSLFRKAFARFQQRNEFHGEFNAFCAREADWLEDYALYMALKTHHEGLPWTKWDKALIHREENTLRQWREKLETEVTFHKFLQFCFFKQWLNLKRYANERGIKIFGDIPIYVSPDSADVWANQEIFSLDEETGEPLALAGVPPDYFSPTGQLWGNPVYNWDKLKETSFAWWIRRVKGTLALVDIIRIDHFRGFAAYWAVPRGETTAVNGQWLEAPGDELFSCLRETLGQLPIVAEDLGVITPDVEALRDKYGFPGMKVLQFAFDSDRANPFLPYNYNRNCVVYTGTHDNDTIVGWFEKRSFAERQRVVDYLGGICNEGIHWSMIRLALSSVANLAIFPLQDVLGLGSEAKMNTPGTPHGNWEWRFREGSLTEDVAGYLCHVTYVYGRLT